MATGQTPIPDHSVQQNVAGDHNIVAGTGPISLHYSYTAPDTQLDRRSLEILLDRVSQFWIEGVLKNSLHGEALLSLGKEVLSEPVEHPWARILELPGQTARALPMERCIGEIFAELTGFLLILGEPGSGKTTTLLELASALVECARKGLGEPVPVVFNLSTWATGRKPLVAWLVDELKSKYFVSRRQALAWLNGNRLIPLLDGLDEVESGSQRACVEAINDFVQESGPPGLVVCSRTAEYQALPMRLRLNGAVLLQPLTSEQIADYFDHVGPRLASLKAAVKSDPSLRELARSPLMLSIMVLAYRGTPIAPSSEGRQEALDVFSTYIESMFERKGKGKRPYSKEESLRWLTSLAQGLRRQSQTVFLSEQLQPTWLTSRSQRWAYLLGSRILPATAIGFCLLLQCWLTEKDEFGTAPMALMLFLGLAAGLVDGLRWKLQNRQGEPRPSSSWHWALVQFAVASLVPLKYYWFADMFGWYPSAVWVIFLSPIWGFILGSRARYGLAQDIRPIETLTWSWRRTFRLAPRALLAGIAFGVLIFLLTLYFLTREGLGCIAEPVAMVVGIYFGMLSAILLSIGGGLGSTMIEAKSRPNQGIILSIRNCLLTGLGSGMLMFPAIFLLSLLAGQPQDITVYLTYWAITALLTALWFGGLDVLNHYTLRLVLCRSGLAPFAYPRFLDYATKLIFLQKVGGGYIFRHRLLLEHFAAREEPGGVS